MNSIIFSYDNVMGNVTIQDGNFFVMLLDHKEISPFDSPSVKTAAKYLVYLFQKANTEIEFKLNYNGLTTSGKNKSKIKELLTKPADITIKHMMAWLLLI